MPFKSRPLLRLRFLALWTSALTVLTSCGAAATAPQQLVSTDQAQLVLTDAQGQGHPLAQILPAAKATVLVFWAAGCPCVRRYQERSDALLARWQPHGIQVLGVAANADETLADVARARQERRFILPVWRDRGGQLAEALQVRTTPTVVVLLPGGQVAYRGWIDNERLPGDPTRQAWLDDALTRLAAGDFRAETRPSYGCRITRGTPEDEAAPSGAEASSCGCKLPPTPASSPLAPPN